MFSKLSLVAILALAAVAVANDPADSWLSYGVYKAPNMERITYVNTTWIVPNKPSSLFGSNAPGWWFGVQDSQGDGALIQPILAWGYQGLKYSIFNGVFDWTDGSWHVSETLTVNPGDKISSYVEYKEEDNSYDMYIYSQGHQKGIKTNYKILSRQGNKNESVAYFVLEHQPNHCSAYPADGKMSFENINVEVAHSHVVSPTWQAVQQQPACNSKCTVVDPHTLEFTWDPSAVSERPVQDRFPKFPKWNEH